jgi:hypothetical protein
MVRFVNLAPDAPSFDVTANGETEPVFAGLSFKSATQYREIDADTYDFEIRNSGGSDAIVAAEGVEILAGRYYTIITRGFVNPPQGNTNILCVEVLD